MVAMVVLILVLGGVHAQLDAASPGPGSSVQKAPSGPVILKGTLAIRTIGKYGNGTPLSGATLWHLTIAGASSYGPYNIPLNTTKTLQAIPGNYTAQGAVGELNNAPCPSKAVKIEAGKTAVIGYVVTKTGPGQVTCALVP